MYFSTIEIGQHFLISFIDPIQKSQNQSWSINSFAAKFKIVVWDYFHFQYYSSFQKANNRINQKYVSTYGHELNIAENSEVPAQTPPLKGGVLAGTALFSLATVVAYGGERANEIKPWQIRCTIVAQSPCSISIHLLLCSYNYTKLQLSSTITNQDNTKKQIKLYIYNTPK